MSLRQRRLPWKEDAFFVYIDREVTLDKGVRIERQGRPLSIRRVTLEESFDEVATSYLPVLRKIAENIGELPSWVDKEDVLSEMLCGLWRVWKSGKLKDASHSYILKNCWFFAKNYLNRQALLFHPDTFLKAFSPLQWRIFCAVV